MYYDMKYIDYICMHFFIKTLKIKTIELLEWSSVNNSLNHFSIAHFLGRFYKKKLT